MEKHPVLFVVRRRARSWGITYRARLTSVEDRSDLRLPEPSPRRINAFGRLDHRNLNIGSGCLKQVRHDRPAAHYISLEHLTVDRAIAFV